jgi:uroporphyrinogen III methyltransferase / synthase
MTNPARRPPRILVTRPAEQAGELVALLARRNVEAVSVPTVAIDASRSEPDLDAMLGRLAGADWLVVTSANGAEALGRRLAATGAAIPVGVRVAAVGPATAEALGRAGIAVDHVPATYRTVAIAEGLGAVDGRRVVLARADAASRELPDALTDRGAAVEEVVAYRTVEGPPHSASALERALENRLEGVAFTSPSTVRGLLALADRIGAADRALALPAFCIGPVTADAAGASGFVTVATADPHTGDALADAIASHH